MATLAPNIIGPQSTAIPPHVLKGLWDMLAMQLTPFNTAKVVSMTSSVHNRLDDGAKHFFLKCMSELTGQEAMLVRDGTHFDRYLLGPAQQFRGTSNGTMMEIEGQSVFVMRSAQNEPESESETEASTQVNHDVQRIPRPPNAYILYRKDHHHIVKAANPGIHNNEISVILGSQWNNETKEVRAEYAAKAEQIKEDFMRLNPTYKYRPRRPEQRRRRRGRNTTATGTIPEGRTVTIGQLQPSQATQLQAGEHQASIGTTPTPAEQTTLALAIAIASLQHEDLDNFNREIDEYYSYEACEYHYNLEDDSMEE